jgi:hypothetical protein
MADLADVEQVIVSTVTQLVYPNGTAAASVVGQPCKVYRGWPVPANLTADLKAGYVNISVFPLDMEQNVTRYTTDWQELPTFTTNLTMTVSVSTITIAGTINCPQNVAVLVNSQAFVYPLQSTDTPTSIATALAALIGAPASSIGPVITVPGATTLATRIGAVGSLIQEVRRQKKSFRITIWCNSPLVRDAVARVIDPGLASLTFITLPDGSQGRIRYERTHPDDVPEKALLFRRDLVYSVEYGTTNVQKGAALVSEIINLTGGLDPNDPPVKSISI